MSVCHTGEIVMVLFQGLSLANSFMFISFRTFSFVGVSDSSWARTNGLTSRSNRTNIVNPLFIV